MDCAYHTSSSSIIIFSLPNAKDSDNTQGISTRSFMGWAGGRDYTKRPCRYCGRRVSYYDAGLPTSFGSPAATNGLGRQHGIHTWIDRGTPTPMLTSNTGYEQDKPWIWWSCLLERVRNGIIEQANACLCPLLQTDAIITIKRTSMLAHTIPSLEKRGISHSDK